MSDFDLNRATVDTVLAELQSLFIEENRLTIDDGSPLAQGGYGVVRRADLADPSREADKTKSVAVKRLRSDSSKDLRVAYRLLREIKIWSTLDHPRVLRLIGFYLSQSLDVALLVCPWEPLGNVEEYLASHKLSDSQRMKLVSHTIEALEYLHSLQVTHGDIKAANVLLNKDHEAVLCDFGLAKAAFPSGLTTSDELKGSIAWCSPELFNNEERTLASDVWAWACLVLEGTGKIMKGHKPYEGVSRSIPILLNTMIHHKRPPESKANLETPIDLWSVLEPCWRYEASARATAVQCRERWGHLMTADPTAKKNVLFKTLHRADCADFRFEGPNAPITCFEGTRLPILSGIDVWARNTDPNAPRMYSLGGIAGTGKSTIAKTIALRASLFGNLGASFFFSGRGAAEQSDSTLVLPTLAFRLAGFDPVFAGHLGEALEGGVDPSRMGLSDQLQTLFVKPMRKISARADPVLIVVDALDECDEAGMKTLLPLLLKLVQRVSYPLRLLITSRPEPYIVAALKKPNALGKVVVQDIETTVIEDDIRLYLRARLSDMPKELDLAELGRDWFTEEQLEDLIRRARKLFIYASTVLRLLADKHIRDPQGILRLILKEDLSLTPAQYAALDQLYLEVLTRALPTTQLELDLPRYHAVVGTLILIRDPLPVREMEEVMGVEQGYVRAALLQLPSLILTPESDTAPAHTYHPSFPEFIADPSRCSDPYRINVQDRERRLAIRCLTIMNTSLKRNIADIPNSKPLLTGEVSGLQTKVTRAVPPHLRYVCCYWASHLSNSKLGDLEIIQQLEEFCEKGILHWLEVLSLVGRASIAATCAKEAEVWAIASGLSPSLIAILHDTYRFSLAFLEQIASGPDFVYRSALPFCPQSTTLYRSYIASALGIPRVKRGVESQWSPCLITLFGHTGLVWRVAFSPDGSRLASGSDDCTIRVWDVASGAWIVTLEGHTGEPTALVFAPDGSRLASSSSDHTVRIWDAASDGCLGVLTGHTGWVWSIAFSPDSSKLVSASEDKTLKLWDVASGVCLMTLEGHTGEVYTVAVSPSGQWIASGSADYTVRLWNVADGTCLFTLSGHTNSILALEFSPDGEKLASGADYSTRIWEVTTGVCLSVLEGHSRFVRSISFSPDGAKLASGSEDSTIQLWDTTTGASLAKLEGHTDELCSLVFSPDGSRIASGSPDFTVRLWDVGTTLCVATFVGHTNNVQTVRFSPDGTRLASAADAVRIWDVARVFTSFTPNLSEGSNSTLSNHTDSVYRIAISPDGSRMASASADKTLRLWDMTTDTCLTTIQQFTKADAITFSPNGSRLASGVAEERIVNVWDVASGHRLGTLAAQTDSIDASRAGETSGDEAVQKWTKALGDREVMLAGHKDTICSMAFSEDSSRLVSGADDETVQVWDVASGKSLAMLEGHTSEVDVVIFSSDNGRVASASADKTIRVWEVADGSCITKLKGHTKRPRSIAFARDGSLLASGGKDETVRLWALPSGACLTSMKEHTDSVGAVAFSPDMSRLVSASDDKTIRIWQVPSGDCLTVLRGHTQLVWIVTFSPGGAQLASGSKDKDIRLWDVVSGACLAKLEGHTAWVRTLRYSPDGSLLASGSDDQTVRLWDVSSAACVSTMAGHTNEVDTIAFSQDGSQLASAAADEDAVRVWSVASGGSIATAEAHSRGGWNVAFSPDSIQLAAGSWDDTVSVWEVDSGACIAKLQGRKATVRINALSPDGSKLASALKDGTVRVSNVTPGPRVWINEDLLYVRLGSGEAVRVCHIPKVFSVAVSDISESTVVLGCEGGEVLLLDVSHLNT